MSFFLLLRFLHIASAIWFVGGLISRQMVRAYAAQTDALAKGQITPELHAHASDSTVKMAHWFELGSITVLVFLIVFKPF